MDLRHIHRWFGVHVVMASMAIMSPYNLWRRAAQSSQQETQTEGFPIDLQSLQKTLSICIFAILIVTVLLRTMMLRRRGTRVIVFGKTDKSDFLLMPLVLAMLYTVLAGTFGWPLWPSLLQSFWLSSAPGWLGLGLCAAALMGLVFTLISFGTSFRVGIDEDQSDQLVTGGMFALSRNPVYVCFMVFVTGLFLVHCNGAMAVVAVLFALALHRQVLREEKFLRAHYGEAYEMYCRRVRRYV